MVEFKKNDTKGNKLFAKDKTTLFDNVKAKDELNIIIKSDVQGSSEALKMAIEKIEHNEVEAKIILSSLSNAEISIKPDELTAPITCI